VRNSLVKALSGALMPNVYRRCAPRLKGILKVTVCASPYCVLSNGIASVLMVYQAGPSTPIPSDTQSPSHEPTDEDHQAKWARQEQQVRLSPKILRRNDDVCVADDDPAARPDN
jgi:hypothetical protein